MPILTDKQEPDDFDKPSDDDPNAYALSYLFSQRRASVELLRTGKVLILSGAGANLMATPVLWFNLDFGFSWVLLLVSIIIPILGGAVTYLSWTRRPIYVTVTVLLVVLEIISLLLGQIQMGVFQGFDFTIYYLPGVLVITIGCILIRLKKDQTEIE